MPRIVPGGADRSWYIVGRWREYDGESVANLLRIIAVALFYAVELCNYHGLRLGFFEMPKVESVDRQFHQAITAVAVAWILVALAVHLCLLRRIFPATLKFLSTSADVALLTCVLAVSNGPRSPLVVGYFLILTLAALRFSLSLVWCATLGCIAGYLTLLAFAKWYGAPELRVPRYHQAILLIGLGLNGVMLGQVIRRVRGMAVEYAERRSAETAMEKAA